MWMWQSSQLSNSVLLGHRRRRDAGGVDGTKEVRYPIAETRPVGGLGALALHRHLDRIVGVYLQVVSVLEFRFHPAFVRASIGYTFRSVGGRIGGKSEVSKKSFGGWG